MNYEVEKYQIKQTCMDEFFTVRSNMHLENRLGEIM